MRIGIDLGGTKIEGIVLGEDSVVRVRRRMATPQGDYDGTVAMVARLARELAHEAGAGRLPVGIGTPGNLSASGLMANCNSVCLNGRSLKADIESALGQAVRLANDADCLALSEAYDGAAAGAYSVFAAILGTGVGGGIVIDGRLLSGASGGAGEWGHNPLPWPREREQTPPECWCGKRGCVESWLSGPGLAFDYQRETGRSLEAWEIVARAGVDNDAGAALARYRDRLARALASVINVLDPEVIVLGGGLSNIESLYREVPRLWSRHTFTPRVSTRLVNARHGDSSGVLGAARLWPNRAE
jgi:fructokinase